jgi:hypothetical protein
MNTTEEPRRRAGWRAGAAGAFYLLSAPAGIGGGLAIASLQALFALIFTPWEKIRGLPRSLGAPGWALIAFIAWAIATMAWSPSANAPVQAIKTAAGVALGVGFIAIADNASDAGRRLIQRLAAAALVLLMALCLIEALAGMPINYIFQPGAERGLLERNPGHGVSVLLCWLWPVIAALAGASAFERAIWRLLLVGGAIASFFFDVNANIAAVLIGFLAYAGGYVLPRLVPALIMVLLAGWLLAAPWALPMIAHSPLIAGAPESWRIRGQIWLYAADKVMDKLPFGWGFDSARTFTDKVQFDGMQLPAIPLHTHSASLQIWLETGAVGAALAALALLAGAWRAGRACAGQPARAGALAASAAVIGFYWNVSFGMWQEWFVAVAFGAAALVAALDRPAADMRG